MGSTNKTTNYELSQYIGTDKPSWLNDYNNDMLKIDNAMKANATTAANAQSTANSADGKADANTLAIGTLDTQINTPSTGLAAEVAGNTTDIGNINGKIGDTPLSTVAQTLTGAIEEVKRSIPSLNNVLTFLETKSFAANYDGVKTVSAVMDECYNAFASYISSLTGKVYKIISASYRNVSMSGANVTERSFRTTAPANIIASDILFSPVGYTGATATFGTSGSTAVTNVNGTSTNISSDTSFSSGAASITIEVYQII